MSIFQKLFDKTDKLGKSSRSGRESLLGRLLNPHLGRSIRPVAELPQQFASLVSLIFITGGILPADHPLFRGNRPEPTIRELFAAALANLDFTPEKRPQLVLFCAILGTYIFAVILLLGLLFSLFIGTAHAQGFFTPPSQSTDLAIGWLNFVFKGGQLPNYQDGLGFDIPQASVIQQALITALSTYSKAIMVIASIILFYHLAAMIAETAHTGKPMGSAHQIWAPIRLVVAIGLLVPVGDGLNSGQALAVQMAAWGSGLASTIWSSFLTAYENTSPNFVPPSPAQADKFAHDITMAYACMESFKQHIQCLTNENSDLGANYSQRQPAPQKLPDGLTTAFQPPNISTDIELSECGDVSFPPDPGLKGIAQQSFQAEQDIFKQAVNGDPFTSTSNLIDGFIHFGDPVNCPDPANASPGSGTTSTPIGQSYLTAFGQFQGQLASAIQATSLSDAQDVKDAFTQMQNLGWLYAGAFGNKISSIQQQVSSAAEIAVPQSNPPQPTNWLSRNLTRAINYVGISMPESDMRMEVGKELSDFDTALHNQLIQNQPNPATQTACALMAVFAEKNDPAAERSWFSVKDRIQAAGDWTAWGIFGLIDYFALTNHVYSVSGVNPCGATSSGTANNVPFEIGVKPVTGADPISQLVALGVANLSTAMGLFAFMIGASFLNLTAGLVVGFFATMFFAAGFTLTFILPLMPFFRFSFAALAWIGMVIEAVIHMPLVALAHLTPKGDGLPGQKAEQAYYFLLNIFLRPVLLIFGLICGYVIFYLAASLLNSTYQIAVSSSSGLALTRFEFMSRMMYTVIYVFIMYVCANESFSIIDHLPAQAMRWVGGSGQQHASFGDVGRIQTVESALGAYTGSEAIKTGQSVGQGVNTYLGSKKKGPEDTPH